MPPRFPPRRDTSIDRALATDSVILKNAEAWVLARLDDLTVAEGQWLYAQYRAAADRIAGLLNSAYDANGLPILYRRAELLRQIEQELQALERLIAPRLEDSFVRATYQGAYGRAWAIDGMTTGDVKVRLPVLPREAIRALLLQPMYPAGKRYRGPDWYQQLGVNQDQFISNVKTALTQSMINGEGMAQAQRRLRDILGIQTDRRKGFRGNFYQTLMISRTEIMRASNLGALATYEANQDILRGVEFVSAKDERTCPVCGGLDGQVFKFGSTTGQLPPIHPGCRCSVLPVLIDEEIMNRVAGKRQLYRDWAAERGISIQLPMVA